jgi:hypothetical protein
MKYQTIKPMLRILLLTRPVDEQFVETYQHQEHLLVQMDHTYKYLILVSQN